ncbi:MAG: transglutaminase-like domain-containing protein [Candidatus Omnitrophica bacterium]|nr:transglutaminase-like domain-containing protein [Candidatus Omnitrophota bacterium]
MKKLGFLSLLCVVAIVLYGEGIKTIKEIEFSDFFDSWTTDFSCCITGNRLTLRKSVLYQDEEGRTHYNNIEKIGPGIYAKKQFFIKDPTCKKAELFVFRGAGLKLTCNGTEVTESRELLSTGWRVWDVPVKLLKKGLNEFIFTGTGVLLIEPSLFPDRSARSIDGGITWDFNTLGINNGNGEYVVRLRLHKYPEKGIAISRVYDFMSFVDKDIVHGKFICARNFNVFCKGEFPFQTDLRIQYRCGDSKFYNPENWNSWTDLKRSKDIWKVDKLISKRYIQLKLILTTKKSDVAATLDEIKVRAQVEYLPPESEIKVHHHDNHEIIQTSIPFAYQEQNHRTKALRSVYKLDDVVKDGKTELEKFIKLRNWARHTAPKGWEWGVSMWCPPWDALVILATNKQPLALCMCTHYSTIFVQCANSLGYVGRHVILDHHCVAEIWSNQYGKWILMDTGNSHNPELNCHLEHNGIPLNALEIRNLWKLGKSNEIKFVYANESSATKQEIEKFESTYFNNFRRFAIPLRNNFLGNPEPGEPEQGMSQYYCDLYLWYEEEPEPIESPEYGKTSNRKGDFYWTLNQTFIDLVSLDKGTLSVSLYNNVPSFSHYLVSFNDGPWQRLPWQFVWKLESGVNKLTVKSVNLFGLECPTSTVILER